MLGACRPLRRDSEVCLKWRVRCGLAGTAAQQPPADPETPISLNN